MGAYTSGFSAGYGMGFGSAFIGRGFHTASYFSKSVTNYTSQAGLYGYGGQSVIEGTTTTYQSKEYSYFDRGTLTGNYWSGSGIDWSAATAGGGNMTYYTGSSTYKHVPRVYGNTNAYGNYVLYGKEGNFFGRLWYATKAGWNTLESEDLEAMSDVFGLGVNTLGTGAMMPIKILNKGNFYIKGVGFVDNIVYHKTVKKLILNRVNIKTYSKFVGDNPDVFVDNGVIFLQGVFQNFKGKIYNTGIKASEYFAK
ncbi:MAG: hypothetical protein IT275_03915 [Chitinophagales bacterium]|nr:hypothetical protein [Chitinophagales bacterium]